MESKHAHARSDRGLGGVTILRLAIVLVALTALGVGVAAVAHGSSSATPAPRSGGARTPATPLTAVSMTPATGSTDVPSDATLSVVFSTPLAAHTPTPTLTPPTSRVRCTQSRMRYQW